MCNPAKYPLGAGGLNHAREKKLTIRKYFNHLLFDADGRFAKDIEDLLTAQYAVESKQVKDEANIALRQTQGRLYRGQSLTAGSVKSPQLIQQMIRKEDAYRFLKKVCGSPAYFQRVMYDVLAMICQLDLPTWFLTITAADMQWPDVSQTIIQQYGTVLTDEDVKTMSFDDKSKWLRQNPVTAARYVQYHRLNTFFQTFLKSPAHPLGESINYAIQIEFQARGSPHAHTILWIKDSPSLAYIRMRKCASNVAFLMMMIWHSLYAKCRNTNIRQHAEGMDSADFIILDPNKIINKQGLRSITPKSVLWY